MTSLLILIPVALGLGLVGLFGFFWSYRSGQFDDPEGDALRILDDENPPEPVARKRSGPA
ncbi:cbb3-type cytochrome oxidase assembly protein CcoS [Aureimonas glaciei]|uniref:Cbb3-type cytochrome oxidase assembly protein CcoS n=1 Tax=Aureimonas glaciei TaxID=1776957 RepID=A0A917D9G5_9HYPH|nr:cbb3-type cytochrome oxidase assembly protein CcoS [Aureimonas glaciei]GGD15401.1 hypothetical protein GCM10011335_17760 [Aureimonas glaciei]